MGIAHNYTGRRWPRLVGNAMTVHAYCRSSRPPKAAPRPGAPALGVESQRVALLERFPNATVWTDAARSGRSGRRPALRAMLEALQPGDVVACVRLDRLARCTRLAMALELEVEVTRACRIFSLAGEGTALPPDKPDPVAVFQRRVAAAVAELQAAQAAEATAAALNVKRRAGLALSRVAPYGYRVAEGRLEPLEDEQRVLSVVADVTRGDPARFTGEELARILNRRGFRSRTGTPWHRNGALRLARRVAAGAGGTREAPR